MFKRFLFVLIFMTISAAGFAADIAFPTLTGRVVDEANIIDPSVAGQIEQQLAIYEQRTTNQIVVVTIPDLKNISIEDYGYKLGRYWGIGQKGKNNGALLIVAPKEHKMRIEVGYGLEGNLTDAATSVIINRILKPAFKRGDFSGGIQQGVRAMIVEAGGMSEDELNLDGNEDNLSTQQAPEDIFSTIPTWLIVLIVIIIWLLSLFAKDRSSGILLGSSSHEDDDDGPSFSGGGGSFGGGGSSGSW